MDPLSIVLIISLSVSGLAGIVNTYINCSRYTADSHSNNDSSYLYSLAISKNENTRAFYLLTKYLSIDTVHQGVKNLRKITFFVNGKNEEFYIPQFNTLFELNTKHGKIDLFVRTVDKSTVSSYDLYSNSNSLAAFESDLPSKQD